MLTVTKYGADSLRFYLINSPLVRGKDLRFNEKDLNEIKEKLIITYWNSFKFYVTYAQLHRFTPKGRLPLENLTVMNRWILARLAVFHQQVDKAMGEYKLNKATQAILEFTTDLSQWYIRRIRDDVAVWQSDKERLKQTLEVLYQVLVTYSQICAPFIPFMTEYVYRYLTGHESVHLTDWPKLPDNWQDHQLLTQMELARQVTSLGHAQRKQAGIKVRQPLSLITITAPEKLPDEVVEVVLSELNIKQAKQNKGRSVAVKLETRLSDELVEEGQVRDLIRRIQNKRRQLGLSPTDRIITSLPEWPERFSQEIKTRTLSQRLVKGPFEIKPV